MTKSKNDSRTLNDKSKSNKADESLLSRNHGHAIKYRIRELEDKEAEQEIREYADEQKRTY